MAYIEREYKREFEVSIKKVDDGFIITEGERERVSSAPRINIDDLLEQLWYGEQIDISIGSFRYKEKDNTEG